jgi:WD40 repeat protein
MNYIIDNLSHQSTVTCIDFNEDNSLAASGSTDGSVKMINVSSGKIVSTLICGHIREVSGEEQEDSVESVKFCSSLPVLASATVKGVIEVWELSNYTRRCYVVHDEGISTIAWDPIEPFKLFSAGLDGCINHWDARSGQRLSRRPTHHDQILDMNVLKAADSNDRLIVTASEDMTCKVFRFE